MLTSQYTYLIVVYTLALVEKERQRIEQLTAGWDDPTQVNWEETRDTEEKTMYPQTAPEEPEGPVYKCTALYSYTVSKIKLEIYLYILIF